MITLTYDEIWRIDCLNRHQDVEYNEFGRHTCCDYVDSLHANHDAYGVTMFVEPLGNLTHWDDSWLTALDWWIAVFKAQPKDWDYITAGSYLDELAVQRDEKTFSGILPAVTPEQIWKIGVQPDA